MTPPARAADPADALARLEKARQFADAAAVLYDDTKSSTDLPDAYVTNAVHSGIASADVICIRRLGVYSMSGAHEEAIALLMRADKASAVHLRRLLAVKTKAAYSTRSASLDDVSKAYRAHIALLEAANSS